MDYNLDDPLAGILSDGSDDSFFDDDVLGKKNVTKKKSTPSIVDKKSALFDLDDPELNKSKPLNREFSQKKESLFGLGDNDAKKEIVNSEFPKTTSKTASSPAPFRRVVSKESISNKDVEYDKTKLDLVKSPAKAKVSSINTLDILGDRTESKKDILKPLEKGKSSQSLLDDILGGPSTKTSSNQPTSRPKTQDSMKTQEFDFNSILSKSESKQTLTSAKPQKPAVKPPTKVVDIKSPKKEVIQSKKTKPSEDWLGLFKDQNADGGEEDVIPAWLAGGDTQRKKSTIAKITKPPDVEPVEKGEPNEENALGELNPFRSESRIVPNTTLLKSSNDDITTEGAAIYLQQQESQLAVALQLKAQEEKLLTMQMRQQEASKINREATKANREQLEAMLHRQAENRQQMQALIAAHQERISQRIKALLGPPKSENDEDEVNIDTENDNAQIEHKDTPHSKEKKQLIQLVQSLQENHDKEIDLMETSYRRQLAFLEVSLHHAEERMKEESEKLVKFYTEKMLWLEEHHGLYKKMAEDNLKELSERKREENEMLRQQHLYNVKILQEHHLALMENIKNSVHQEQILIKDSSGFSSNLTELLASAKENKENCRQLVHKVQEIAEKCQLDTDKSFKARDEMLNDMLQQLKKERENFETEKAENRDIVKSLETRLKQMTTMIEEESAALKQKRMEFEFEKATFSKQTEFAKNVLKKQDEELKILKEHMQKEHEEKIAIINEENANAKKNSLIAAKDKLVVQNLRQELEKMKTELEIQLEEVTAERSKLNIEKQNIHLENQRVMAKSRDLELLAKSAIEKQNQADTKYSEAESIQRKYEERIRRIQEHVVSLNSREKHIAREKVALSRERLNLHNERKQLEGLRQCSLCRTSQNLPPYTHFEPTSTLPETYDLSVSRDYGASAAMTAVESEMAHLLGRNLGLRNTVGGDRAEESTPTNANKVEAGNSFADYMDPKLMMLRLDVQKVISNIEQSKKNDADDEKENNQE